MSDEPHQTTMRAEGAVAPIEFVRHQQIMEALERNRIVTDQCRVDGNLRDVEIKRLFAADRSKEAQELIEFSRKEFLGQYLAAIGVLDQKLAAQIKTFQDETDKSVSGKVVGLFRAVVDKAGPVALVLIVFLATAGYFGADIIKAWRGDRTATTTTEVPLPPERVPTHDGDAPVRVYNAIPEPSS